MTQPQNLIRPALSHARLLFYFGGFAPIGGIETFARNLLTALRPHVPQRHLALWGPPPAQSPLLADIQASGVALTRSSWSKGCRWGWPDKLLLLRGRRALREADLVLFGKTFSPALHQRLRAAARATGRNIPFVFITPYRPAELWKNGCDPGLLHTFDLIVVQAAAFADDLIKLGYTGHIETIPYIPGPEAPLVDSPPTPPLRIGFLGRLEAQKNLAYLLEAMAILAKKGFPAQLHLFGQGSQLAGLQQRTRELGLQSVVHFEGAVQGAGVQKALDSCHFFALSSTTEGQALVVLEALARGRAVLGTPVGAMPEILNDKNLGRLAPLDDAPAYAAALQAMAAAWQSGQYQPRQVQALYQQRFGYQRVLEQYLNLFNSLLPSHRSAGPSQPSRGVEP